MSQVTWDQQIQFDPEPREIQGQRPLDALTALLRAVERVLCKPMVLT